MFKLCSVGFCVLSTYDYDCSLFICLFVFSSTSLFSSTARNFRFLVLESTISQRSSSSFLMENPLKPRSEYKVWLLLMGHHGCQILSADRARKYLYIILTCTYIHINKYFYMKPCVSMQSKTWIYTCVSTSNPLSHGSFHLLSFA